MEILDDHGYQKQPKQLTPAQEERRRVLLEKVKEMRRQRQK
jgi:hypothetical protein